MVTAVLNFSRGPVLAAGDKGVHIIFIPDGIGSGDPGADGLPTAPQLAEAASCIGTPKKTDVIVFAGRPWHLAGGLLLPHPQVHALVPETVLDLFIDRGEKAVWWSEGEFNITEIEEEAHNHDPAAAPGPAQQPAPPPFDIPVTQLETDVEGLAPMIHVARSTVPVEGARGHEYKITFVRNGVPIDPNMRCN